MNMPQKEVGIQLPHKVPELLYRYRSIAAAKRDLKNIFVDQKLYFSNPNKFNDPFDCRISVDLRSGSIDELVTLHMQIFSTLLNEDELKKVKDQICGENRNVVQERIAKALPKVLEEMNCKVGAISLSETPNEIVMWSHYADNHKGVVLIFDPLELGLISMFSKVDYCETFPLIDQFLTGLSNPTFMIKLLLCRKSESWRYEKEWRAIAKTSSSRDLNTKTWKSIFCSFRDRVFLRKKSKASISMPCKSKILKGIIFGTAITPQDKQAILGLLSEKVDESFIISQAIKSEYGYYLEFIDGSADHFNSLNSSKQLCVIFSEIIYYCSSLLPSNSSSLSNEEVLAILLFQKITMIFENIWFCAQNQRKSAALALSIHLRETFFYFSAIVKTPDNMHDFYSLNHGLKIEQIKKFKENPKMWENYLKETSQNENAVNQILLKSEESLKTLSLEYWAELGGNKDLYISDYLIHKNLTTTEIKAIQQMTTLFGGIFEGSMSIGEIAEIMTVPWFYLSRAIEHFGEHRGLDVQNKLTYFNGILDRAPLVDI